MVSIHERRSIQRRRFGYYMCVTDDSTQQIAGHLTDISPQGFRMDSERPMAVDRNFRLRFDLIGDMAEKSYITFVARSRWCQTDVINPLSYNVGFEIVSMTPSDKTVFEHIVERYGS